MKKVEVPYDVLVDAVAVLIGDYPIIRKKAAHLLLRMVFPASVILEMMEDGNAYPYSRNDSRVLKWKQQILAKGKCEMCGSTENLQAHHIIRWVDYPHGRIDINNGECLCRRCHIIMHSGTGKL